MTGLGLVGLLFTTGCFAFVLGYLFALWSDQ